MSEMKTQRTDVLEGRSYSNLIVTRNCVGLGPDSEIEYAVDEEVHAVHEQVLTEHAELLRALADA